MKIIKMQIKPAAVKLGDYCPGLGLESGIICCFVANRGTPGGGTPAVITAAVPRRGEAVHLPSRAESEACACEANNL